MAQLPERPPPRPNRANRSHAHRGSPPHTTGLVFISIVAQSLGKATLLRAASRLNVYWRLEVIEKAASSCIYMEFAEHHLLCSAS
jgi:hypothetical protein